MENILGDAHVSMLREMQDRETERRELEELARLREEIGAGDNEPGKMTRALELFEKYFGL